MSTPPQPSAPAGARRALIVGRGIAGLAPARTLAGTGVSLELIESRRWLAACGNRHLPPRQCLSGPRARPRTRGSGGFPSGPGDRQKESGAVQQIEGRCGSRVSAHRSKENS
jgi:hypothetical protein